jgi:uncharacterized protein (TIGR01244 family)
MHRICNLLPIDERLMTAGQPTQDQLAAVAQAGFEVVINLALHDDPRYSLPDEAGLVRSLGLQYIHIPVQFGAPSDEDLQRFCDAMDAARGCKVFVHCAANKRVTAFLGLYRVLRLQWSEAQAFDAMRSIWEPDAVWSAFIARTLARAGRRS